MENTNNNTNLTLVGEYSLEAYKTKFNTSKLDIIDNPKKPGSLFFACGMLPNGKPNYGAIGQKAKALIEQHAPAEKLRVSVYKTEQGTILPILQANSNANVVATY